MVGSLVVSSSSTVVVVEKVFKLAVIVLTVLYLGLKSDKVDNFIDFKNK